MGTLDEFRTSTAKSDGSPVTAADMVVQLLVLHGLRERIGAVRVIAEETPASLGDDSAAWSLVVQALEECAPWSGLAPVTAEEAKRRLLWGRDDSSDAPYWSLDPIDGTSGWVAGRAYATCLGFIENDRCLAGGIAMSPPPREWNTLPSLADGLFLTATLGAGCHLRSAAGPDLGRVVHRVRRGPCASPPVWLCSVRGGSRTERGRRVLDRALPDTKHVPIDSQCKYGLVALGHGDLAFRVAKPGSAPEQAWDHAAGMLVASESGAATSDIFGVAPHFGADGVMRGTTGTLACAGEHHAAIVAAIAQELAEESAKACGSRP